MSRQPAIVRGLARRTPWAGIDDDTLTELYLSAATTISRLAVSGGRPDWRTPADLERAAIAAFRNEAFGHWKTLNAHKRRADRESSSFDPDRDGAAEDPLERIFQADPDEELVAHDWLAQLRGQVRAFWEPVILEGIEYKEAGERLGVDKARRQALYREGIEHLGRFRALTEEGRICQLRAPAIVAYREGTADATTADRARAHLDCCLACALTHEQDASALKRGILQVFPVPAIARGISWLRDLASGGQAAETAGGAGGALVLGKGVAALCAGALAVCASQLGVLPDPLRGAPPATNDHHVARAENAAALEAPVETPTVTYVPSETPTTPSYEPSPEPGTEAGPVTPTTTSPSSTEPGGEDPQVRATAQEFDPEKADAEGPQRRSSGADPKAKAKPTHAQLDEFDPETTPETSSSEDTSLSSAATTPVATASTSTSASAGSGSTTSSAASAAKTNSANAGSSEFGGP